MSEALAFLCSLIRTETANELVVPFLGAGASLADREEGYVWDEHDDAAPNGGELAALLGRSYGFPADAGAYGLARVAQFVDIAAGPVLRRLLRGYSVRWQTPTCVHRLLAEETAAALAAGEPLPWPLLVTTNYDDLLERALEQAGVRFDLVTYRDGWFRHRDPDHRHRRIDSDAYRELALDKLPVVVKLHGSLDRRDKRRDSFVISEDDYIAYMTRDPFVRFPVSLMSRMRNAHFLFLGYGLEDWNLRVFLFRLWEQRSRDERGLVSWAIQREADEIDHRFWARHGVDLFGSELRDWVDAMKAVGT